jgi:SP family general alpha glucoside:H+ symporter-like MFS transporter
MESYCIFLMGQFIATAQFAHDFGVYSENKKDFIIEASWQSAFQCSGPVGALIGVFIVGPITSRIGYRWTTIGGLMFLNAFIFIFYFGNSQGVFMAAQILEGQHGLLLSAELRGASSALQGDRPYYSGAVHPFDLLE